MSPTPDEIPISQRTVFYALPEMDAVRVRRDEIYRNADARPLAVDLYYPPSSSHGAPRPGVVLVTGYPDPGYEAVLGCKFKEMGWTTSWARLAAASGIAAIAYTNYEPVSDLRRVLRHLRENAESLGIDERRIGLWASSGSAPLALSVLIEGGGAFPKCAVLLYGYTMDLDGSTGVAAAAAKWKFVNPCAGKSVDDLPRDVPLLVARAGRDEMPGLNDALDRFLFAALARNLPLTCVNAPEAPHAFDLLGERETSRHVIQQILAFTRFHLVAGR